MNKEEFKKIAMAIKTAYPNSNVFQDTGSMDIWFMMLSDLPYEIVQPAVLEHISTNKFAPSIAEVREKCAGLTSLQIPDWGEAWESVLKAIRRFGYMQEQEAYGTLDEITKKCVKRIGYQNICASENITADRANFRMMYEQEAQRQKTDNQLPLKLRNQKQQMLSQLVENISVHIEQKEEPKRVKVNADMDQVNTLIENLKRSAAE
jgi:hypothetical protein